MQHQCKLTHFRKGNDNNVIQVSIVHDFLIHYNCHQYIQNHIMEKYEHTDLRFEKYM